MDALRTLFAAISGAALISIASAEPAVETKGRYSMTPVEGGFMRLDSESGAVSICTRKSDQWACEPVDDKAASSDDKGRLEAENKELKDRIRALEDSQSQGKAPSDNGPPGGITKLPTEKEVDEALDYVERMYKKFRDRIQKLDPPANTPSPKSGEGGSGAL
jgi:hypothetical protein